MTVQNEQRQIKAAISMLGLLIRQYKLCINYVLVSSLTVLAIFATACKSDHINKNFANCLVVDGGTNQSPIRVEALVNINIKGPPRVSGESDKLQPPSDTDGRAVTNINTAEESAVKTLAATNQVPAPVLISGNDSVTIGNIDSIAPALQTVEDSKVTIAVSSPIELSESVSSLLRFTITMLCVTVAIVTLAIVFLRLSED